MTISRLVGWYLFFSLQQKQEVQRVKLGEKKKSVIRLFMERM